jgi:hypothetical protein
MRINGSSGALELGLGGYADPRLIIKSANGGDPAIHFDGSAANRGAQIKFLDNGSTTGGFIDYHHNGDKMNFGCGSASTVQFSIQDGRTYIGGSTTSNPFAKLCILNAGLTTAALSLECTHNSAYGAVKFRNSSGEIGSISKYASSVTYNTTSDYRLKENVDYIWDATTRLKQLKPARFNFIVDDTNTLVDGFLAHEVSSVVPEAIWGTKDAVDSEGNLELQQIDQSKLIPLLVKTIQELEARIAALEE